jgi:hypothetical protein
MKCSQNWLNLLVDDCQSHYPSALQHPFPRSHSFAQLYFKNHCVQINFFLKIIKPLNLGSREYFQKLKFVDF